MSLYSPSTVLPVYALVLGIGILLTCLRVWVRLSYHHSSLGADDVFILAGVVVVVACTAIQFYNALAGTAGEVVSEQEEQSRAILAHKVDFAMIVIEKIAFGTIKLSLLFFYRRIFGVWPSFRWLNIWLVGFVVAWTLSFAFADLFLCESHIELQWALDQTRARHGCGDKGALLIAFAATSILTDVLVLGLPLLYIRRLQMSKNKKFASSVVFFLGTM